MPDSLCGRKVCQHLCSRVCHCPAGMARVHWLWLCRRAERGGSEARPVSPSPTPPELDAVTESMSRARAHFNPVYAPYHRRQRHPESTRATRPFAYGGFSVIAMVILALVLLFGLIVNGTRVIPDYDTNPAETSSYAGWWEE